eukprot:4677953-Pleurochrysis_carterae.AAC.1
MDAPTYEEIDEAIARLCLARLLLRGGAVDCVRARVSVLDMEKAVVKNSREDMLLSSLVFKRR